MPGRRERGPAVNGINDPVVSMDPLAYDEPVDRVEFGFAMSRREFSQLLGAGLLIVFSDLPAMGQQARGGRGGGGARGGGTPAPISARLHLGKDGSITL